MTTPVLSQRQRAALAAICDTLVPSVPREDDPHGFFGASHEGTDLVPRVERLIGLLEDPLDSMRLRLFLTALGTGGGNLLTSGSFRSLQAMDLAAREAVLRG